MHPAPRFSNHGQWVRVLRVTHFVDLGGKERKRRNSDCYRQVNLVNDNLLLKIIYVARRVSRRSRTQFAAQAGSLEGNVGDYTI